MPVDKNDAPRFCYAVLSPRAICGGGGEKHCALIGTDRCTELHGGPSCNAKGRKDGYYVRFLENGTEDFIIENPTEKQKALAIISETKLLHLLGKI